MNGGSKTQEGIMIINVKKSVALEDADITTLKEARVVLEKMYEHIDPDEYIDIYGGEWSGEEIESFLALMDALCYQKGSVMTIHGKDE